MPLATTRALVASAQARGDGIGAFNVITLEHAEAVVAGASAAEVPVILQISENAIRFHLGQVEPIVSACLATARAASVQVAVHLDHIEEEGLLHEAAAAGVSSAMFDASKLDYAANVAATRRAADWAHEHDLYLEAELGEVGGKDGAHAPGVRTDPREAAEFVAATGVDALAVAVGSSHAMTTRTASLDFDLISALRDAVAVPLVLHGSSGVPDDALRQAVAHGIVKVNIGTILNVAYTHAVRATLAGDASLVDPRKYLAPARDEIAAVVQRLAGLLSTNGRTAAVTHR
ncbi:MAG TPA: class II fructose-bisphosphate aldolase [Pseudonocardia sp.]|jgi:fructose-bisphosphate aldolase class II|nr:class II fructose-bisphosphate aldolase [Pseudonocardia sp.]